jgi:hypothetical protein
MVRWFTGHPGDELLAVFRDDMRAVSRVPALQFFGQRGLPWEFRKNPDLGEGDIEVTEFRAPGRAVAARLDLLGVYEGCVRRTLAGQLRQPLAPGWEESAAELRGSRRFMLPRTRRRLDEADAYHVAQVKRGDRWRESRGADGWVGRLASSPEEPRFRFDSGIGGRSWLMKELADWDPRDALRAVLLAFPEADVTLATADTERNPGQAQPSPLPSKVMAEVSARAGVNAPVVVLTEGRTDAEFLKAGLTVLRPYLTDLIRFLDYERRPEGGVGALTGMIRAFAAAGIANRVVAVFDNDTAAADAIRKLDELPPQIQVIRYPDLDLAKAYPTLEPATPESPEGTPSAVDVNGRAASIELYLGRDVLTRQDGTLRPVQWTSYVPGMNRRQGQITDKKAIHQAFRAKAKAAHDNPQHAQHQDWTGLRLIIDAICAAARHTTTSDKGLPFSGSDHEQTADLREHDGCRP